MFASRSYDLEGERKYSTGLACFATYLMGFDMRSKGKRFTGLKHLRAVPANDGSIHHSGGRRNVLQALSNECVPQLHSRKRGVEMITVRNATS